MNRLPVLPLRDVVLFPNVVMPLLVGRPSSLGALAAAEAAEGNYIFLVAQRDPETTEPTASDLFRVGVIARVTQVTRQAGSGGTARVLMEAVQKARATRYWTLQGSLKASVVAAPFDASALTDDDRARARQVVERFEEYVALQRRIPSEVVGMAQAAAHPERTASLVAAHLAVRHDVRQRLLEATTLPALLSDLLDVLSGEIDLLRLERKIDDDVRGSLWRNQREFYLQEQLKAIHRELGQEDDDGDELATAISARGLPDAVRTRAEREARKLRRMSPLSPEATVSRNYLEWLLALPWHERTDDVLDVAHAAKVLDEDHYGLADVKDRLLDYIAVLSQARRLEGPILCLVGPPGVGKTSLGRSIARALGRRFVRMSLGGIRDEAEIRGHRRTYIGALPGRIIQAMRRAETVNPVLLLDEIDKLGHDWRGDPSAALLEVLDPEQNRGFSDHFLEVDYDLSQVLFLVTANSLGSIPEPLRDRLEIVRLSGYLDYEKVAIARQFLVPRQFERSGIEPSSVVLEPDVLPAMVRGYTREAGVRELERRIARVARKIARRRAEHVGAPDASVPSPIETAPPLSATSIAVDELKSLLGVPPYDPDDTSLVDKVGVANGLAYTAVGGEVLEVEVSAVTGRGRLQLTGTLGDVMKESALAAVSYARARARALGLDPDFHRGRDLHVHIPAGATPKDGPSAGIAIAVALASALTGRPVRGTVAMTGEISLRGRVLPIGGLKEKAVAAFRVGIREIVIPRLNMRELEEMPAEVVNGIRFVPADTMDDVLRVALRPAEERATATTGAGVPAGPVH